MNKIKLLPQNLVSKIAAGEVIERPASVVKELVENSIDAGAKNLTINIQKGGIAKIEIIDDGEGMTAEDAKMATKLHATSKLAKEKDLDQILTMGFRGEALASISSVSELIIHTKTEAGIATELIVENGEITSEQNSARTTGTTIVVNDLFRHLPARKKFLKTEQTEYKHCLNEIYKIAIANPQIGITLSHNGKQIFKLKDGQSTKARITSLISKINESDLIVLSYDGPGIKISGMVMHPKTLSSDRSNQYFFVNQRYFQDFGLLKAVKLGYGSTIPKENQPGFFIFIETNPQNIDVNIHPRKLEVKFGNASEVFKAVKNSVDNALEKFLQNELKSKLDSFSGNDTWSDRPKETKYEPEPKASQKTFSYESKSNSKPTYGGAVKSPSTFDYKPRKQAVQQSLSFTKQILQPETTKTEARTEEFNNIPSAENKSFNNAFQVLNTYIIIESEKSLQIIDQHAADERINFERMLDKIGNNKEITSQNLLIPISMQVSETDLADLKNYFEDLSTLGLDIDEFGKDKIKINSIPQFARKLDHKQVIDEILKNIQEFGKADLIQFKEKTAASLACHGSIRAGQKLDPIEINKLVEDLFKCKQPYSCPHGRPIIWTLDQNEIEKKFMRVK